MQISTYTYCLSGQYTLYGTKDFAAVIELRIWGRRGSWSSQLVQSNHKYQQEGGRVGRCRPRPRSACSHRSGKRRTNSALETPEGTGLCGDLGLRPVTLISDFGHGEL